MDPVQEHAEAQRKFAMPRHFDQAAERVGFPLTPLTDLYYLLLKGSWAGVLAVFGAGYLATNVIFALLYMAGGDCIEGAEAGNFWDAFFFSVQTIATIGYGGLMPTTAWANALVTVESMVGILAVAMVTGITFAKFARPRANTRFSNNILVAPYDGRQSLYFRVANVRGNDVAEATIRVSALVSHTTKEGHSLRRLHALKLVRDSTPLFRLSWLVVHVIDEHSPLYGRSLEDLYEDRTMLIVSLMGMDATFAQAVNARHVYMPQDVLFDHHFVDVISDLPGGRIQFDFEKFHEVRPLSAAELALGSRLELEEQQSELLEAEAENQCVFQRESAE